MNILVIGNGFDLAHELPTKYIQFLEFCKRVFPIYENVEGRGVHLYQQEYLFDWDFNKETPLYNFSIKKMSYRTF